VVDDGALVVGRGGEVTRYPLPAPDVHLSPLDGEPSLLNARRGDRWNVQGAGFVRATQPWTMSAALYTTEASRHLARANDDGAVYASDGAGGWRRIWTDLSRMAIPLGVVNDRALFDVTGALYAARRDGRGAGQLEPWVTEGFWPEAAHTQGDARTPGVVAGQQRFIWHIDGKRAQALPGQMLGDHFAAEAGGVTVVARVREDALLYVYPDGRVSEGRQGIADGFNVNEVFTWRGAVFALANAPEDQPARVYKLGAGEVWSEHARGPEGTIYAQLLSQQGGRVLLSMGTFRTGVAHELTADGVSALRWVWDLRPQVVAMTPTRTFARLPDKRCVMIAADGAPSDAPLGSCEGSAPRVRGEAMSIVRLAQAPPSALEIWWMSPGEAAPTLRATLPAPMWQPPHYIGAMTDDAVYFVWWTPERGEELWVWDEAGGARVVADLWPGVMDSRPTGLQVIGGALYFTATSPDGRGVWRIGATGQAPQLLHAPVPGVSPSEVLYMQPDGRLLFSAHSPEYGEELWALEP
jgi:ELWxxDGT repeat protein